MAKKLSPWCKEAKKKMIDMDLEVNELASSLGLTRPYVSSVLNGRVYHLRFIYVETVLSKCYLVKSKFLLASCS